MDHCSTSRDKLAVKFLTGRVVSNSYVHIIYSKRGPSFIITGYAVVRYNGPCFDSRAKIEFDVYNANFSV